METSLLVARIEDTADICEKTQKPKFLGFLSREQSVLAQKTLAVKNVRYSLFGGYDDAERVVFGCFPDWAEELDFPITAVTFSYRRLDKLSHRDFLGSLMGLGITRESVGDILIEDGRAVVFLFTDISDYVLKQIQKIGRIGVKAEMGFSLPLPQRNKLMECSSTVASERLDCIVAAICNISRSEAALKISEGLVTVNSVVCEKVTKSIESGDILSVRGKGKFIIDAVDDRTRKNRIVLKYKKYI